MPENDVLVTVRLRQQSGLRSLLALILILCRFAGQRSYPISCTGITRHIEFNF